MDVLWYGGGFVADPGAARVPLDDPGYLLGDGVFATMRGYEGRCLRAAVHLADLARAAGIFGIGVPAAPGELEALVHEAAARTGARDAYVRVTLTRGERLSILGRAFAVPAEDDYARGIATAVVGLRRIPASCMDPTVKATGYAASVLARREATARGVSEGVQLAVDGSLACGTMANLFVVLGGELLTPAPAETGCRNGVTRRAVIELARARGMTVREARLDPSVLARCDEAFFTSTRVECLPISAVDGAKVGRGAFPIATALRAALRAEALAARRAP